MRRPKIAGVLGSLLLAPLAARSHEGHGGSEIGPYDLDSPRHVSPETALHIGLQTVEVDFGMVEDVLRLSGIVRIAPDRRWTIGTRTAGKILHVGVQAGDRVKQGDVLIEIDSPELARNVYEVRKLEAEYQRLLVEQARSEGRVKQLRVESGNAQEMAGLAEAELERSVGAGEGAISLNDLVQRRTNAIRARGEAKLKAVDLELAIQESAALKTQAEALRLSRDALAAIANVEPAQQGAITGSTQEQPMNLVRLLAPADGVVIARKARPGHWASPGETLLEVADLELVQIEGELPESLIARVIARSSDKVRIRFSADPAFLGTGAVRFISPVLDEIKRTAHVLIEAPNADGVLRDGMFADLAVVLREEKTAVVVPSSAVMQDGPVHFVFVKDGDIYQKQDIAPGLSNDQFVEVLAGLAPGDVVVSQGAYSLTQLRPKTTTAAAAPASGVPAPK